MSKRQVHPEPLGGLPIFVAMRRRRRRPKLPLPLPLGLALVVAGIALAIGGAPVLVWWIFVAAGLVFSLLALR